MEKIDLENLCKKLRCSVVALDFEKLNHARDMLYRLQDRDRFESMLGTEPEVDSVSRSECSVKHNQRNGEEHSQVDESSSDSKLTDCQEIGEEECVCWHSNEGYEQQPEDDWHGYFPGYQILTETTDLDHNEHKKCIELTHRDCDDDLDEYLRAGIRCFLIDLFCGTMVENQKLIVRLRENELQISKEFNFPVMTTLCAKLSPRLQYLGLLDPPDVVYELTKGDEITLTTNRHCSTRGTKQCVYVNAQLLLEDITPMDFLLVGCSIQLQVQQRLRDCLHCSVHEGGLLKSRLPVLFPGKCNKFRISIEELEDITFAKEVGINVIFSYVAGTPEYYNNLQQYLRMLNADKMRLGARIVLNEVKGCDDELQWAAHSYDCFLIEVNPQQQDDVSEVMHLCPAAETFIEHAFELQKPILMDAMPISLRRIMVYPEHYPHIFYYPDKYVFKCDRSNNAFYFDCLQAARFATLPAEQLAKLVNCDNSQTGSDSLARACAATSIEAKAAAILVCSFTGRMAIKISHFRPKTPIICISPMKSASDFISIYHHIVLLYYRKKVGEEHRKSILKQLIYGLLYANSRRVLQHAQNVLLVYGKEEGPNLPDKYIIFKYDQKNFAAHLNKVLFTS